MGAVVIVEVDESVVGGVPFGVGVPGPDVSPFLKEDAVEAFDLPFVCGRYGRVFLTVVWVAAQACAQRFL